MSAGEAALFDCAKRRRALFQALRRRYWLYRFTGGPIRRHEMLMRWAISQGPGFGLEAVFLEHIGQQMRLCDSPLGARLGSETLIRLRQQSHGLSLALPVIYPEIKKVSRNWLVHFVEIPEDPKSHVADLARSGGLVLTGHSFFHNALGAVLGILGCRVYGVAAPMGVGPDWPVVGPITKAINQGSERLFHGGRYLYTDNPRDLVSGISKAKADCGTVVGLLDHGDLKSQTRVNLLGWNFGLQHSLVARWQAPENPIYFAMLWPVINSDGVNLLPKLQLRIENLKPPGSPLSPEEILNRYAKRLTDWASQAPWAWQGFRWTDCFARVAGSE